MPSYNIILLEKWHSLFFHKNHIWLSLCSFWELICEWSYNLHFVKSCKLAFTISSCIFQNEVSVKHFSLFTMALQTPFSVHLISSAFFGADCLWMPAASYVLWIHRLAVTSSLVIAAIAMIAVKPFNINVLKKKLHSVSNHMISCVSGLTSF